jgi:hypothetical protein
MGYKILTLRTKYKYIGNRNSNISHHQVFALFLCLCDSSASRLCHPVEKLPTIGKRRRAREIQSGANIDPRAARCRFHLNKSLYRDRGLLVMLPFKGRTRLGLRTRHGQVAKSSLRRERKLWVGVRSQGATRAAIAITGTMCSLITTPAGFPLYPGFA